MSSTSITANIGSTSHISFHDQAFQLVSLFGDFSGRRIKLFSDEFFELPAKDRLPLLNQKIPNFDLSLFDYDQEQIRISQTLPDLDETENAQNQAFVNQARQLRGSIEKLSKIERWIQVAVIVTGFVASTFTLLANAGLIAGSSLVTLSLGSVVLGGVIGSFALSWYNNNQKSNHDELMQQSSSLLANKVREKLQKQCLALQSFFDVAVNGRVTLNLSDD